MLYRQCNLTKEPGQRSKWEWEEWRKYIQRGTFGFPAISTNLFPFSIGSSVVHKRVIPSKNSVFLIAFTEDSQ